jgi:hypothetical protein
MHDGKPLKISVKLMLINVALIFKNSWCGEAGGKVMKISCRKAFPAINPDISECSQIG